MQIDQLSKSLVENILNTLGVPNKKPTLRTLNRLIHAYIRRVPWESVSRIVKRQAANTLSECPRWPDEFWHDAIQNGFGGTCFESSLAFFSLLSSLGYEGYLTINDMGESRGCHAAIVLIINHQKYLVDITIPLQCALHFDPTRTMKRRTSFQNYTIRPDGDNVYQIERSHHPHKNIFTLIDKPVNLTEYQSIVENDYTEKGHFLKSVVMVKVIDDKVWRFFSDHTPYRLEVYDRTGKNESLLSPEKLAYLLSEKFYLPEEQVSLALAYILP